MFNRRNFMGLIPASALVFTGARAAQSSELQQNAASGDINKPLIASAPFKIATSHIPLRGLEGQPDGTTLDGFAYYSGFGAKLWLPTLKATGFHAVLSGHTHKHRLDEPTDDFGYTSKVWRLRLLGFATLIVGPILTMENTMRVLLIAITLGCIMPVFAETVFAEILPRIRVSENGEHFVRGDSDERFVVWGVNYDHNSASELLDEYWIERWDEVVEDFAEIKQLGANCIRVHLQLGKFLDAPDRANQAALDQLVKLVKLSEQTGLYLDITGLACYHKANVPDWYDQQSEQDRWRTQAFFWESVAKVCRSSPAVFCYDLMNEPIFAGEKPETDWLAGELGGMYFVQRLTLDMAGRSRPAVAKAWVDQMVDTIRKCDDQHLITVGVIPWVFVFGGGKPLYYSPEVSERLDFASVHFYPKKDQIDKAITALKAYDIGKPLVVEEMFPMNCSDAELAEFVTRSKDFADGWISFYWGSTAEQLRATADGTIAQAITAAWLERFQAMATMK